MKTKPNIVAIAYDLDFRHAAEIFSGVSQQVKNRGLDWQLLPLNFAFEAKLMELAASGRLSGAIGTFVSDEWIRGLHIRQVAALNLFNFSRIESAPTISLDDEAIGRVAAQHLLEQGAMTLSFIGQDQAYFNQLRRRAFEANCPAERYLEIHPMAARKIQAAQLKSAKLPVGVLCSNDHVARELCNEARQLGLVAGRDLLVVGVGNEPIESTFAGINLSSFELPSREIGYRAAHQMAALLAADKSYGGAAPIRVEHITAQLHCGESTLASAKARLAERARTVMAASFAHDDFDIARLCRTLGVSRRSLELATAAHLAQSPHQILSQLRQSRAQELLKGSNQAIAKIGEACGYPEAHHFSAWFKKQTGMSPRNFRSAK